MTGSEAAGSALAAEHDAPPKPKRPGRLKRAFRWWLGGEKIRVLAERRPTLDEQGRELLARARVARELADRIFGGVDPPRYGSGLPVAIELYRQAAYWAFLAERPQLGRPAFADLLMESDAALSALGLTPEERDAIERLLVADSGFIVHADLPASEELPTTTLAAAFVARLFERHDAPARRFHWGVLFRALRLLLIPLLLAAAIAFAVIALKPRKPNLADGKPWTTSSSLYPCYPEKGDCGGFKTRILFHTRQEKDPWYELDLGKRTRFSGASVYNRSDYGPDRAVPLVIEVSDDKSTYREVARRTKTFSLWEAKFPATEARYVRVRVDRTSMLHLEGVEIHP